MRRSKPILTFGRDSNALTGTIYVLERSTDLTSFTEVFRSANNVSTYDPAKFSVTTGSASFTITDLLPPLPKAFYRFRALSP